MDEAPSEEETNTATMRPMFEPAAREDVVAPAQEIGRFMVLGRVGAGGMGQVYAAYDPVLDRRVALKLLHAERSETDRDALVREAKALARLTHPHVVAVHDVGVHDGLVFLAMEYVEGRTLKEWVADPEKGDLAASLDVLHQAGLGLAAAHEAGLVHGDFKPHNVLVGEDGRVRVADFGLARPEGAGKPQRARPATRTMSDGETVEDESRHVVAGTPAYMAPEHVREGRVDPRTDQYSFCVAAWEVLYGLRPPEVANAVELPSFVSVALKKGLAERSSGRHRSMRPLLDALRTGAAELRGDRARRVGRVVAIGGALVVVGAVGAAYWMGQAEEGPEPCTGAEAALAKVWNAEVEAGVRSAILSTELPFAERTEAVVIERLDRFGAAWVEGHTDACEAGRVRLEQSTELMDQRMGCLEQRLRELRAATFVLESLGNERVDRAIDVVTGLPLPGDCVDVEYVRERTRVPADPQQRLAVEEVREELARVGAMHRAGRYVEAESAAEEALAAAEELRFKPLLAEANAQLGAALIALEKTDLSIATLKEAFLLAQTVSDAELSAGSAIRLSFATGVLDRDLDAGMLWSDIALSVARREGLRTGPLRQRGLAVRSDVLTENSDFREALAVLEESMAMLEVGSELYAGALSTRAGVRLQLGDLEEGVADAQRSLELYEESLGPNHPTVAGVLFNLGLATSGAGRYEEALKLHQRARDIYVAHQGPEGPDVGASASSIALIYGTLGRPQEALAQHEEALRILRATVGSDHVKVAGELVNMGMILDLLGRREEAVDAMRAGREVVLEQLGPEHVFSVTATMNLANILADGGETDEALALYRAGLASTQGGVAPRAESLLRSNLGLLYADLKMFDEALEEYDAALPILEAAPLSFSYQNTLANAADVWLETGGAAHALEKGEELLELSNDDPTLVARAQFLVARALWQTKGDRTRARSLATEAEAAYIAVDENGFADDIAVVREWLASHR